MNGDVVAALLLVLSAVIAALLAGLRRRDRAVVKAQITAAEARREIDDLRARREAKEMTDEELHKAVTDVLARVESLGPKSKPRG